MGLDVAIFDKDDRTLATKRIGNVEQVAFLRDLATVSLGSKSMVVSKMLYNGTHSGDSLAIADLDQLFRELLLLEGAPEQEMKVFGRDMLEMVRIARQYERPLCFA